MALATSLAVRLPLNLSTATTISSLSFWELSIIFTTFVCLKQQIYILNNYNYELETYPEIRKDITSSINDKVNYDKSGFNIEFDKERIKKGNYSIFVKIENVKNAFFDTKRTIKIE